MTSPLSSKALSPAASQKDCNEHTAVGASPLGRVCALQGGDRPQIDPAQSGPRPHPH